MRGLDVKESIDNLSGMRISALMWGLWRRPALVAALVLGPLTLVAIGCALWFGGVPAFRAGQHAHGRLAVAEGLGLMTVRGDGTQRGEAMAALAGPQTRAVFRLLEPMAPGPFAGHWVEERLAHIDPDHLAEIDAVADGLGIGRERLRRANLLVDVLCTAVVVGPDDEGPLRIGRNMDFGPPYPIGRATVVQAIRRPDVHALVSIGWPGFAGVVTGMNERGLTAALLLNHGRGGRQPGTPVPLRVREVLEHCDDVEQALVRFAASPVASDHYLLLADAQQVALTWHADGAFHVRRRDGDFLLASNGAPLVDGGQDDARTRHLQQLLADGAATDVEGLRRLLSAVHMPMLNAQAMVLVPAERRLLLSLAGRSRPASRQPAYVVDLAPLLAGGDPQQLELPRLPAIEPLPRY